MTRRALFALTALLTVALLMPTQAYADTVAEDCADGEWDVRPGQTLGLIAFLCDTTVSALADYNNLENPNLINPGQILLLPPTDFTPGDTAPPPPADNAGETPGEPETPPAADPPPAAPPASGAVSAALGPVVYDDFNSFATVDVTVTNNSLEQGVAGGRFYPPQPGDDGPQYITLLDDNGANPPAPIVNSGEPLWKATVYFDDGTSNLVYAGCTYMEEVFAEGDEPLDRRLDIWFHWEVTLPGGWFDCGNTITELRHPPDLYPGQSGTSTLTIYLEHPGLWDGSGPIDKDVSRIDVEVFDVNGNSLGVVASQTY